MTDIDSLNRYIEKSGLQKQFIAEKLSLSRQGLLNKLNGTREFSVKEILLLCNLLKISKKQRESIFFTLDVDEKSTAAKGSEADAKS